MDGSIHHGGAGVEIFLEVGEGRERGKMREKVGEEAKVAEDGSTQTAEADVDRGTQSSRLQRDTDRTLIGLRGVSDVYGKSREVRADSTVKKGTSD